MTTHFELMRDIGDLTHECHGRAIAAGWWTDPDTGEWKDRNVGELLMLCVSELSEAMEGHRKGLSDDHLPHRLSFDVEIADVLIRIFDLAGAHCEDLPSAFVEKLEYNRNRADHRPENRTKPGGKKY